MIALLLLAAGVLAAAPAPPALPARAERRYRVELGGEPVGFADLAIACGPERCSATWESALRAPAGAGGRVLRRRIAVEARRDGEALGVRAWQEDGRGEREVEDGPGPIPASLAETLLSAAGAERLCLPVREEASGRTGLACARREGAWLEGEVLGVPERFRARPGEPPEEVRLPGQRTRFLADPRAGLPERAPRLFGAAVRGGGGPPGAAARFCGVAPEPPPPPAPPGIPLDFPEGKDCQEKTARWLARAGAAGLAGRHVVGVAWDGEAFVWHEWAEVRAGGRWTPVDPSFRQAPAAGPRFAVARFAAGDLAAEAEAGERVLACWAGGRVEGR